MKSSLFREKSIERVSSPEQLNDYIRVTDPSVWIALAAVVFLLTGICVWGIFGKLDTVLKVGAITEENQTVCYVKESDIGSVSSDMKVRLNGEEYAIEEIAMRPVQIDESFPEYLTHLGGLTQGEWVYAVMLHGAGGVNGGIYEAEIVIESISPMTFVTN